MWRGELSPRRLSVLVYTLPPDAATIRALSTAPGWTIGDFLLADIFYIVGGQQHPARPDGNGKSQVERDAEFDAALVDHKRRMAERTARLAAQPNP